MRRSHKAQTGPARKCLLVGCGLHPGLASASMRLEYVRGRIRIERDRVIIIPDEHALVPTSVKHLGLALPGVEPRSDDELGLHARAPVALQRMHYDHDAGAGPSCCSASSTSIRCDVHDAVPT